MKKRFSLYIASLGILLSTVFAVNGLGGGASAVIDNTPDCDNVAVIKCGAFTVDAMRDKASKGDVPRIFNALGISQSDLSGEFRHGIVYRDGRVTVDDKVVATGAMTAGRNFGGTPIAGTNAGIYSTSKFVTEGQTAYVKMAGGKFQFAVIKSCGNPVKANPVPTPEPPKPVYSCDGLNAQKISRTQYRFSASATAKNGATLAHYRFDFGDGKTATSQDGAATHTYARAGNFTVRVTAVVKVGGKNIDVASAKCVTKVTVPEEEKPSVSIDKKVEGREHKTVGVNQVYTYNILVKNTGNVTLTNAKVTDTPPAGVTLIKGNVGTVAGNIWTHTIPSLAPGKSISFTLTAKVPAYKAGTLKNTVCVDAPQVPGKPDDCDDATVDVPKPGKVVVCDPATGETITVDEADADKYKPVNDPACGSVEVCDPATGDTITVKKADEGKYKPVGDAACEEHVLPAEITKTGPETIVAGLLGSSALGYGAYSYWGSRRALISKMLGR